MTSWIWTKVTSMMTTMMTYMMKFRGRENFANIHRLRAEAAGGSLGAVHERVRLPHRSSDGLETRTNLIVFCSENIHSNIKIGLESRFELISAFGIFNPNTNLIMSRITACLPHCLIHPTECTNVLLSVIVCSCVYTLVEVNSNRCWYSCCLHVWSTMVDDHDHLILRCDPEMWFCDLWCYPKMWSCVVISWCMIMWCCDVIWSYMWCDPVICVLCDIWCYDIMWSSDIIMWWDPVIWSLTRFSDVIPAIWCCDMILYDVNLLCDSSDAIIRTSDVMCRDFVMWSSDLILWCDPVCLK